MPTKNAASGPGSKNSSSSGSELSSALAKITRNPSLTSGNLLEAIQMISREGCEALQVSNVGIWTVNNDNRVLHNIATYILDKAACTLQEDFSFEARHTYMEKLATERLLVINDIRKSTELADLNESYSPDVCSLLDAPVRVGGELVGVVCIENNHHVREWSKEEQNFASSLADMTALALEATARKKNMDDLEESRRRTETLMSNLPGMVYQCLNDPPDFTFTFVSEGAYQLTGYTPEQLMHNNALKFLDMIHPDDAETLEKLNQETLVMGLPLDTSFRLVMADGSIKWIWERSRVVETNPDGTPHLLEGFYTDITEQRQLEAAALASKAKSEFLANMSHEIRTPMNAIVGMSELVMRENISPVVAEYMRNIRSASGTLLSIINDILDFSKIEAGAMELIPCKYAMASFISDVSAMTFIRLKDKPIRFILDDDPALPAEIYGDFTKVKQILINLLTNAVKFTQEGHIRLTIRHHDAGNGKIRLKIAVEDTGMGIRQKDLPMLFEHFTQLDTKKNRSIEGTGLGLAICKKLVGLMNGTISVESVYGQGSTFSFEIDQECAGYAPMCVVEEPGDVNVGIYMRDELFAGTITGKLNAMGCKFAVLSAPPADGEFTHLLLGPELASELSGRSLPSTRLIVLGENYLNSDNALAAAQRINMPFSAHMLANLLSNRDATYTPETGQENSASSLRLSDTRILVVDDIDINLIVAESLLEDYGAEVVAARSGKEALNILKRNKFDIVFMDHMMPEMDGVETTALIRRQPEPWCRETPIIALTANAISGVKEMFIENGMNDFLAKPLEVDALKHMLERWVPEHKIHYQD